MAAENEIKFTIEKPLARLTLNPAIKTAKEVNLVRWGEEGKEIYVDIRKWKDGVPGKGISLTREEAYRLYLVLGKELEEFAEK